MQAPAGYLDFGDATQRLIAKRFPAAGKVGSARWKAARRIVERNLLLPALQRGALAAYCELKDGLRVISCAEWHRANAIDFVEYGVVDVWPRGRLPLLIKQDDFDALVANLTVVAGAAQSSNMRGTAPKPVREVSDSELNKAMQDLCSRARSDGATVGQRGAREAMRAHFSGRRVTDRRIDAALIDAVLKGYGDPAWAKPGRKTKAHGTLPALTGN